MSAGVGSVRFTPTEPRIKRLEAVQVLLYNRGRVAFRNLVRVALIVSRKVSTKTSQSRGWSSRHGGML